MPVHEGIARTLERLSMFFCFVFFVLLVHLVLLRERWPELADCGRVGVRRSRHCQPVVVGRASFSRHFSYQCSE